MQALITTPGPAAAADGSAGVRQLPGRRAAVEAAKAQIQPLVLEHMDVAAAAEMPRAAFEATPEEHHELTRFQAIEGKTWNNPVLAGRYLLVRNAQEAACYELPLADEAPEDAGKTHGRGGVCSGSNATSRSQGVLKKGSGGRTLPPLFRPNRKRPSG